MDFSSRITRGFPSRTEWLALALLLALAAFLRLGAPDVVEFKRDEANLSFMALDLARGLPRTGAFPLLGIDSSVGIPNAPMSVYLLALPYLFTSDPTLATQFIGLLNVLAVGLVYLMTRRYFGTRAALVATLLYAISPWAVIYSRKIWAQDMLPPFVLLTVFTGLLGFVEGKRTAQLAHLPLLAITGQIHYGAFVLIPVSLFLIVSGRRRLSRAFLIGLVLAVLVSLPYALGALRAFQQSPGTFAQISPADSVGTADRLSLTGKGFEYADLMIGGAEIHSLAGPDRFRDFLALLPGFSYPLFNGLALCVWLAAAYRIWNAFRRRGQSRMLDLTLLIWLFFSPLIYSITWTLPYPHYLIPMLPAAYIVLGAGISNAATFLARWTSRRRRVQYALTAMSAAVLLGFGALQVHAQILLVGFLYGQSTPGGFGTPLAYLLPVRSALLADPGRPVLARLDSQFVGVTDDTTVWNFLLYDLPDVRFLAPSLTVYPAKPAALLTRECISGGSFTLRAPQDGCYSITGIGPGALQDGSFAPISGAGTGRFANGLRMLGTRWNRENGCLSLLYATDGRGAKDFFFAVHYTDVQDHEIAPGDVPAWRGAYWRAGDHVVQEICSEPAAARRDAIFGVHIGMYTYQDTAQGRQFENVDVLDTNNAPAGQSIAVRFPPQ